MGSGYVARCGTEGSSGGGLEWRFDHGERLLGFEGTPQQGAQPGGVDAFEQVGNDDAIDHVGEHGDPSPIAKAHRDDHACGQTPDGSVETDGARWTAETGRDQPLVARDLTQRAGGGGEPERRCFHAVEYRDPL